MKNNSMKNSLPIRPWLASSAFCLFMVCNGWAAAQGPVYQLAKQADYEKVVQPFLVQHCVRCHGEKKQAGDFRVDQLRGDLSKAASASQWIEVMDRLNLGEMPPADEPQPEIEKLRQVTTWVAAELRHAERFSRSSGGRVLLRRLNRTEYTNTIRDLLHMNFLPGEGPLAELPPDGTAEGFDKVSTALMMDPSLLEKYFQVAGLIADQALVDGPPPFPTAKMRLEMEDIAKNQAINYLCTHPGFNCRETDVEIMEGSTRSFGVMKYPGMKQEIPVKGMYRIRIRASADPGERGEPVIMRLRQNHPNADQQTIMELAVHAKPDNPQIYEVIMPRDEKGGEYNVSIVNGSQFMNYNQAYGHLTRAIQEAGDRNDFATVLRLTGRLKAEGLVGGRPNPNTADTAKLPKLFVDWLEVEGPLYDQWPPKSHQQLLFQGEQATLDLNYARQILQRLMPRAYRRAVEPAEMEPILRLIQQELDHKQTFNQALRAGLTAVLTSPNFLYLQEPSGPQTRPLNDYELATRLSYFLWSSMPDDTLFALAKSGQLRQPAQLTAQVNRMLADAKSEALVQGFANQWLRAGQFRTFRPDERLYKQYSDELGEAMVQETLSFFREILQKDLSVLNFLDSDWTMLNERLANFYEIPGVTGEQFRAVKLPAGTHRGGLLAQAGVAMYGSDGNRTKPVTRGVYIREVLFNNPPDPPPPNVGEIEPNIKGKNLTVRQRLLAHQQIESCAACHRTIDPYGLALENFNVVGLWRDQQDGEDFRGNNRPPVEVSGQLPNGQQFTTFDEFKNLLTQQKDRFSQALAERLLIYSLGRSLEPSDRTTVDALAQRLAQQGYTLRSLIHGIVQSPAFTTK